MTLQIDTPVAIKHRLRKSHKVPCAMKAAIYKGCTSMEAAVQFNSDVVTYNTFEALLFVESYEKDGFFAPGTAKAAMDTFINSQAGNKVLATI